MDLKKLIEQAIEMKQGDKEFALFYYDCEKYPWIAEIGNPSKYVCLGEIPGEIGACGATSEEAVAALLEAIAAHNKSSV